MPGLGGDLLGSAILIVPYLIYTGIVFSIYGPDGRWPASLLEWIVVLSALPGLLIGVVIVSVFAIAFIILEGVFGF